MDYSIHTNVRYGPLERVEAGRLADECTQRWWNQTLCRVNDCVARIGVFEGEFHWHKHDREDEFFYVIEGRLLLDLEGRTVELAPRQGLRSRGASRTERGPRSGPWCSWSRRRASSPPGTERGAAAWARSGSDRCSGVSHGTGGGRRARLPRGSRSP